MTSARGRSVLTSLRSKHSASRQTWKTPTTVSGDCSAAKLATIQRAQELVDEVEGTKTEIPAAYCPQEGISFKDGSDTAQIQGLLSGEKLALTPRYFESQWNPCDRATVLYALALCRTSGDCEAFEHYGANYYPGGTVGQGAADFYVKCTEHRNAEIEAKKASKDEASQSVGGTDDLEDDQSVSGSDDLEAAPEEGLLKAEQLLAAYTGKGKYIYPESGLYTSYEGDWVDGEFNGKGGLVLKDGSKLEGHFLHNGPKDDENLKFTPPTGEQVELGIFKVDGKKQKGWYLWTNQEEKKWDYYTWDWIAHQFKVENKQDE